MHTIGGMLFLTYASRRYCFRQLRRRPAVLVLRRAGRLCSHNPPAAVITWSGAPWRGVVCRLFRSSGKVLPVVGKVMPKLKLSAPVTLRPLIGCRFGHSRPLVHDLTHRYSAVRVGGRKGESLRLHMTLEIRPTNPAPSNRQAEHWRRDCPRRQTIHITIGTGCRSSFGYSLAQMHLFSPSTTHVPV